MKRTKKYCACGCGQRIKLEKRFVTGHNTRIFNPFKGKHHSKEVKELLRKLHIGLHHSEDTKKKISESGKGRIVSLKTRKKMSERKSGANHHNWKGGMKYNKGRWYIRIGKHKYIERARLVMQGKLGRRLTSSEIVHHKNEITDDDRPDNLELKTRSSHMIHHSTGKHHSEETKVKIGLKSLGRTHSQESKNKVSQTLKGNYKNHPEIKDKISKGVKKYYVKKRLTGSISNCSAGTCNA
jgi:hypothetical protein